MLFDSSHPFAQTDHLTDNEYYQALSASAADAPTDGPDWFPIQVISTGEWQWVPAGTGDPQLGTQGFPTYLFGGKAGSAKFFLRLDL